MTSRMAKYSYSKIFKVSGNFPKVIKAKIETFLQENLLNFGKNNDSLWNLKKKTLPSLYPSITKL